MIAATVDMGPVTFDPAAIPLDGAEPVRPRGRRSTAPPTGATRPGWATRTSCSSSTIPSAARVTQHGPRLEHDVRFPNRTNVEFVAPTPGETRRAHRPDLGAGSGGDAELRHRCVRGRGRRAPARPGRRRASRSTSAAATSSVELGDTDPPRRRRHPRVRRRARRSPGRRRERRTPDAPGGSAGASPRPRSTSRSSSSARCSSARRSARATSRRPRRASRSSRSSPTPRAPRSCTPSCNGATRPTRRPTSGSGKADELQRRSPRRLDVDLVIFDDELTPGAAAQPREEVRARRRRPRRADPRHLRPARDEPGGDDPGRARAAPLPEAAPARAGARSSASRPVASAPGGARARRSSRSTAAGSTAGSRSSSASCSRSAAAAATQRKARRRGARDRGRARRLHERGEVDAAEPARRTPRCSSRTGSSPRSTRPCARCTSRAARRCSRPTRSGFVRRLPHQLVEAFRSTLDEVVDAALLAPRGRRDRLRRGRTPDRRGAHGAARDRRRRRSPSCSCSTRPTGPTPTP